MKTQIFKNRSEFLNRDDKKINGVDKAYAESHPGWDAERDNEALWNCSRCSDCSDCSDCSGCSHCSRCSGCSDCSCCSRCSDCSDCSHCSGCSGCSGCSAQPIKLKIPKIEGIHGKILEAVKGGDFDMGSWHCGTTHCRGGWAITLAGAAGKALEELTSSEFAAMMIFKHSSPIAVPPSLFYDSNEKAMNDIERCAKDEMELKNNPA